MPYKVALTSSDGKRIDQHFGHTESFCIILVDEQTGTWAEEEPRTLPDSCGTVCPQGADAGVPESGGCLGRSDERLNAVIRLLSDCRYLLTARIGKKPHTLLQRAGIIALESPADVFTALVKLNAYHRKYESIKRK